MSDSCRWAVVPAAGYGQRFSYEGGDGKPKQYLSILGKTVIEHSLRAILRACPNAHIVVAVALNDPYWPQLDIASHPQIQTVNGGDQRSDSVTAGLDALQGLAQADDWVLVHDAARPCIASSYIHSMLGALENHEVGGVLCVPVVDTLKKSDGNGHIARTLDRTTVYRAQTPQIFRYGLLRQALSAAAEAGVAISDESSALERLGYSVLLHEGQRSNIKLTYGGDVAYIEATLRNQLQEGSG